MGNGESNWNNNDSKSGKNNNNNNNNNNEKTSDCDYVGKIGYDSWCKKCYSGYNGYGEEHNGTDNDGKLDKLCFNCKADFIECDYNIRMA